MSGAGVSTATPGSTGEASDCVIPSMAALRSSAEVHERVNARLQELERAADTSVQGNCQNTPVYDHSCGLKSNCCNTVNQNQNCDVKSKSNKKVTVVWPQDLPFVGTLRKRPSYEDLTMTQWMLGFLRIAEEEVDQIRKQNMYSYLTDLMQDAADNSSAASKGAHPVFMYRMQDGVQGWRNLEKKNKNYANICSCCSAQFR